MKTLVVASGNKGKIKEITQMLPEYNVIGYKDTGLDFEIEETGDTFYQNALIKAKAVYNATGKPALADDSGLVVNALGGAPGVYSARYAGDGIDAHNIEKLLKNMQGVKDRSCKFVCCMVYYDGTEKVSEGFTEGEILTAPQGTNGFGYDPVFFSKDLKKSLGLATEEEKNSISHRFRAIQGIKDKL